MTFTCCSPWGCKEFDVTYQLKRQGEVSVNHDLSVVAVHAAKHTSLQRLAASQEEQMSLLMTVMLF